MKREELRKLLEEKPCSKKTRQCFEHTDEKSIVEASRAIHDRLRENARLVSYSSDAAASYRKQMQTKE